VEEFQDLPILSPGRSGRSCQPKRTLGLLDGGYWDWRREGDIVYKPFTFFFGYNMAFPGNVDDESLLSSFLELRSDYYGEGKMMENAKWYLFAASFTGVLVPVACVSYLRASLKESL
jgi:hypothetical protein